MGAARHAYSSLTRLLAALLAVAVAALPAFAQSPAPAPVRVMVLPFQVHSARPLEYLEQSLADLLTTRLEGSGRVEVVEADAATATYRGALGSEAGLRQIASERGARFIITGSRAGCGSHRRGRGLRECWRIALAGAA